MVLPRWNRPLGTGGNRIIRFFGVLTVSLRSDGMSVNFLKRDPRPGRLDTGFIDRRHALCA